MAYNMLALKPLFIQTCFLSAIQKQQPFRINTMTKLQRYSGYAGLIPFVGLSLLALSGYPNAEYWLLSYAALIYSFLGGILWQASLKDNLPPHVTILALGAMLWAWLWLLIPSTYWHPVAALSFIGLWLYERRYLQGSYIQGFLQLRCQLSTGAAASLMAYSIL